MESGIDPGRLLGVAEEMAGRAQEEDAGHAALAVLAAHAALEAMVNRLGGRGHRQLQLPSPIPPQVARPLRANDRKASGGRSRPREASGPP
jgi:hypothetical protein